MLRLITGKAGSGKTGFITDEISKAVEEKKNGIIMIVPEQFSHECERELCAKCGDSLCLYADITSFSYLSRSLESRFGGSGKEYLDKGGRLLCMALAVRNVSHELKTFVDAARSPELQNTLLSTIDELKAECLTPEKLLVGSEMTEGELSGKLSDLSKILEAYDSVVANGHADPEDRIIRLSKIILEKNYGNGKKVYIDGFSSFTVAELEVISSFMTTGADVTVCLNIDSPEAGDDLFEETRATFIQLVRRANGLDTQTCERINIDGKRNVDQTAVCCESISDECEYAAMTCRKLVRQTNCRYRDIAIAVRNFDDYKSLLKCAFDKYSVPLFISERNTISTKPLPTMISCAYDIILGGWNSDDVISFVGTGLTPFTDDEADELTMNLSLRRILDREKPEYLKSFEKESKNAKTASEHIVALLNLLEKMNVTRKFEIKATEFPEYLQMWDLVKNALEQFNAILGDSQMSTDEFSRLIKLMLSKYDIGLIPASLDSVSAGDFDRMRKRNIKHLLVLGASEDRLPSMGNESGIFTPDEKKILSDKNITSYHKAEGDMWRESLLIYNCLTLPSRTITYSYCGRPSIVIPEDIDTKSFSTEDAAKALRSVLEQKNPGKIEELKSRATAQRGSLSPDSVEALYGKDISISASRADKFYSCKYAYFCQYGLKAKKWKKDEFTAAEMGDLMHYVLEHAVKEHGDVDDYIQQYVHEKLDDFKDKSARYIYLFNRLKESAKNIVNDTLKELEKSKFVPEEFELKIEGTGIADRIDTWEKDGKKYIRIVDYKTGNKKFVLSEIWYGMNMQMLMYLDTICKDNEDIVPAGVMYVPAKDKYSSSNRKMTKEEAQKDKTKDLRRTGIVLDEDGVVEAWESGDDKIYIPSKSTATKEQFELLYKHIDSKLLEMQQNIKDGGIEANPCKSTNIDACQYCDFASTCGFVDGENGETERKLIKIDADKVFEMMEETYNGDRT